MNSIVQLEIDKVKVKATHFTQYTTGANFRAAEEKGEKMKKYKE